MFETAAGPFPCRERDPEHELGTPREGTWSLLDELQGSSNILLCWTKDHRAGKKHRLSQSEMAYS